MQPYYIINEQMTSQFPISKNIAVLLRIGLNPERIRDFAKIID